MKFFLEMVANFLDIMFKVNFFTVAPGHHDCRDWGAQFTRSQAHLTRDTPGGTVVT